MPLAARILFGVFGLVAAVYAGASLAGHVTPPWWEYVDDQYPAAPGEVEIIYTDGRRVSRIIKSRGTETVYAATYGRKAISLAVGAVGLAALAFAAFARRARPGPPPAG